MIISAHIIIEFKVGFFFAPPAPLFLVFLTLQYCQRVIIIIIIIIMHLHVDLCASVKLITFPLTEFPILWDTFAS